MEARDFYIKVEGGDGKSTIRRHRVWDADRFLRSQQQQYAKEKEGGPYSVTVSSEQEFNVQRKS